MEEKRAQYAEDEILTLELDDGSSFECGIMGVFEQDFDRVAAEFDRLMDEPI